MTTTKTPADMVREYAEAANQPILVGRYATAMGEEYDEWHYEAFSAPEHCPESELKEIADLVYVSYARAREKGYNLDIALERIHHNNMGRMYQPDGTILRRYDGKVLKNKDYPKVELGDLV